MCRTCLLALSMLSALIAPSYGDELAEYSPAKVVYDLSSPDAEFFQHLLDRVSTLQNLYGADPFDASIVVVVHEGAVALFAHADDDSKGELMSRAESLAVGEVIEFRVCRMSARMQGFDNADFPEFVRLVPMADAEIIRLHQHGYAYLR